MCGQNTCSLSEGGSALLGTVGALVSAVVISELSVTPPAQVPGTRLGRKGSTSLYILVWLLSGVALVVGWAFYPKVPELNSTAKAWLGVAIGAAYAYFGISPNHANP